jgi:hypothetical protein
VCPVTHHPSSAKACVTSFPRFAIICNIHPFVYIGAKAHQIVGNGIHPTLGILLAFCCNEHLVTNFIAATDYKTVRTLCDQPWHLFD